MARRLLWRLASMATGEASSSKRSLARCRRGRGRRQRLRGATTMGSQRLWQGKKALGIGHWLVIDEGDGEVLVARHQGRRGGGRAWGS